MRKSALFFAFSALFCCRVSGQTLSFEPAVNYPVSSSSCDHVAVGDMNGDGLNDVIAVTGYPSYSLLVFTQNAAGGLDSAVSYSYPLVYPGARAVTAGDVTGDGKTDIIICLGDSAIIFERASSGIAKTGSFVCAPGKNVDAMKIADVDRDGKTDIVTVSWFGSVVVLYGTATGFVRHEYAEAVGSGYDDIEVADMGSGLVSIFQMGGQSHAPIAELRIRADRSVDTVVTLTLAGVDNMHGVAVGNFFGEGLRMAASHGGNAPGAYVSLWKNALVADTLVSVADIPQPLAAGRLSCDSADQLVVLHGGWNKVSVIEFGVGVHTYSVSCPNNAAPDGLVIADVNNDGKMDIVTANTYAGVSVLKNATVCPSASTGMVAPHQAETKLFPNPASDEVVFRSDADGVLTVVSMAGQVIEQITIRANLDTRVRLESYPSGMYLFRYDNGISTSNHRVVVSK